MNERVASLYSPTHPAVLSLLRQIYQSAKRAKIDISICGEIASDLELTPLLLGLGYTTLSLAPPMIPELKKVIRSVTMAQCRRIARKALTLDTDKQITSYLRSELQALLPEAD